MKRLVMWLRAHTRHDEGSALVVALIVVLAVGIMLSAVLDFAGTGLTSGIQLRNLRNVNYFAEGSVDGAINQIRGSSITGTTGHSCPDYVPPPPPSSIDGATGHAYTVKCTPQAVPGGTGVDQPSYAVLTLSNASGEGLIATGNHNLNIDGGVYSHNEISMQHQSLIVNGSVSAEGACSPNSPADGGGEVASTDPTGIRCNLGVTGDGLDPGYAGSVQNSADLDTLITNNNADPTPTCTTPGVTEFQPGYYSIQPGVLVDEYAHSCASNHVWWFHAGAYFFDFTGTWQVGSPCSGGIPCADDIVGGTPTDSTMTNPNGTYANWSSGSGTPEDDWNQGVPACVTDVTSSTTPGVQFEFGGASKLQTSSTGGIELCGPTNAQPALLTQPDGSNQHIVFTQLPSGSTAPSPTTATFEADSAPSSTGAWVFVPDNSVVRLPDGQFGTTPTLTSGQSATLTYSAPFRTPSRLPKGAIVQSAAVRVYQTTVPVAGTRRPSTSIDVTLSHNGASAQNYSVPNVCTGTDAGNPGSLPYCDVDITSSLQAPAWKDLDNISVKYTATGPSGGGNSGAASVDAVALVISYTKAVAETSSCKLASSCVIWNSTVNLNAFLHGTTYVPTGEMDVEVQNRSGTIFDRGVIVATLHANVVASSTQTAAPFQLPKGTQNGRLVLFTGLVDSDIRVRACVLYQDYNQLPDGTKLAFPGYKATVQSWNVFRGSPGGSPTC